MMPRGVLTRSSGKTKIWKNRSCKTRHLTRRQEACGSAYSARSSQNVSAVLVSKPLSDNMTEDNTPLWENPKPGYKWPVAVAQPITAPAGVVWAAISMPGNLESCHPFCAKNPVERWPGEGSRDQIHYLSGWVFERRFCRWIEGVGYDLEIGRRGGGMSFVSWRVLPGDSQNCKLQITVYPHVLQHIPAAIRWLPHALRLGPMLKRYLSSVTRGVEWYVIRGEPVPRNQFGTHPWFSAPKPSANAT